MYVLAFDTANESIALGVGRLHKETRSIDVVASEEIEAHRASNTQLLPHIDTLLTRLKIDHDELACIVCGRGPGSFTGVRIALATAKGIASALEIPLVGVSTLDAVAWGIWQTNIYGQVLVVADAMRKEVYPVSFEIRDGGVERLSADRVLKADVAAGEARCSSQNLRIAGDALVKYESLFEPCGTLLPSALWTPTGRGLLLAAQAAWQAERIDPLDGVRHDPAFVLPVYTRLSDAEEHERARLACKTEKNLHTGVQNPENVSASVKMSAQRGDSENTTYSDTEGRRAPSYSDTAVSVFYRPLDLAHVEQIAAFESQLMGTDAWSVSSLADELSRSDRVWWVAYVMSCEGAGTLCAAYDGVCAVGYAGGWVVDGELQILKVAVEPTWRRRGVARELLAHVAADARNLGAMFCSLEVRASNKGARAFYEALGFTQRGVRPRYYSDREDAFIMEGPLPLSLHDVAGMDVVVQDAAALREATDVSKRGAHPLILALESSCDETAAALVDGSGMLVADVVASQIDFHARFGGVVPEIASRKHIEAICGVCDECLSVAATNLKVAHLAWRDLDAVAVTYAPGLVGALVVGVAFAKGAAWALKIPFIGVNHLEGHLYANKIGTPDFAPPAVVSLVSGGNTLLVHMKDWGAYETLGSTIDDAVGEAFDKVSKALDLGYPGGPLIARAATQGNPQAINFPRAMLHSGDLRFSLSGLKTAVITYINQERSAGRLLNIPDIAASFQQAVIDVQVAKAERALLQTEAPTFCLGGGVAANTALRQAYEALCSRLGVRLVLPPLSACGDNAGMIALVALDRFRAGKFYPLDTDAQAHASLDDAY